MPGLSVILTKSENALESVAYTAVESSMMWLGSDPAEYDLDWPRGSRFVTKSTSTVSQLWTSRGVAMGLWY